MAKIQKLPKELIQKIAAGEIIERPASVVKELLENAIDAKATYITIKLENGGKDLIEVIDNGIGINKEDLPIVLERHTTSKIHNLEDMANLRTLGFRGEALHAISSISKLELITKTKDSQIGYSLSNTPNINIKPVATPQGTRVIVKDLFYNIPARRKFLKSANTELKHILDIIEAYLISFWNIGFKVIHNNKEIYLLQSAPNAINRLAQILKIPAEEIIKIEKQYASTKATILLPIQKHQLQNKGFVKTFVNKRYIKDNTLHKALKEGLTGYIPSDTKISAILNLEVPPSTIDVNIHPRKLEIKFENPYRIFHLVKTAIQENINSVAKHTIESAINTEAHLTHNMDNMGAKHSINSQPTTITYVKTNNASKNFDSKYNNAVYRLRSRSTLQNNLWQNDPGNTTTPSELKISDNLPFELEDNTDVSDEATSSLNDPLSKKFIDYVKAQFINSSIKNIIQVFNKYIIAEIGSDLWVIDQHAAFERVRYEKLLSGVGKSSQSLLEPLKLNLSKSQLSLLEELIPLLEELGFSIVIKNDAVLINAIPADIPQSEAVSTFYKVLSNAQDPHLAYAEFKAIEKERKSLIAATLACHTTIRTGDTLTKEEAKVLIEQLLECNIPTSCPHGRPTIHVLNITDIDKWFLRTY